MERLIYKEEQSFRQSVVPWIMLASGLVMMAGFGKGFYQQLYQGQPYGDEPMSNNGLIWSSIFAFVVMSAALIIILNSKLLIEIWSDGIRYKFPPMTCKTRFIPLNDIVSAEVTKYRPIIEFGGWGWRKRFLQRKTAYSVSGKIGIRVIKKNGSQVMLGTHQQDEMKRAVTRMMQPEIKYSI